MKSQAQFRFFLIAWGTICLIVSGGCATRKESIEISNHFAPDEFDVSSSDTRTQPPFWADSKLFGPPITGMIRVAVLGDSMLRPGYYYLPKNATVGDAIEIGGGLLMWPGRITTRNKYCAIWRKPYSGVERVNRNGVIERSYFTSEDSAKKYLLMDRDCVFISYEYY